jgi:hypothetical protein
MRLGLGARFWAVGNERSRMDAVSARDAVQRFYSNFSRRSERRSQAVVCAVQCSVFRASCRHNTSLCCCLSVPGWAGAATTRGVPTGASG